MLHGSSTTTISNAVKVIDKKLKAMQEVLWVKWDDEKVANRISKFDNIQARLNNLSIALSTPKAETIPELTSIIRKIDDISSNVHFPETLTDDVAVLKNRVTAGEDESVQFREELDAFRTEHGQLVSNYDQLLRNYLID